MNDAPDVIHVQCNLAASGLDKHRVWPGPREFTVRYERADLQPTRDELLELLSYCWRDRFTRLSDEHRRLTNAGEQVREALIAAGKLEQ